MCVQIFMRSDSHVQHQQLAAPRQVRPLPSPLTYTFLHTCLRICTYIYMCIYVCIFTKSYVHFVYYFVCVAHASCHVISKIIRSLYNFCANKKAYADVLLVSCFFDLFIYCNENVNFRTTKQPRVGSLLKQSSVSDSHTQPIDSATLSKADTLGLDFEHLRNLSLSKR